MERKELTLDELQQYYTDVSLVEEASRQKTFPSGDYQVEVREYKAYVTPEEWSTPGRHMVDFKIIIFHNDETLTQWCSTSFEVYRKLSVGGRTESIPETHEHYDKSLPLDSASKKWAKLVSVVDPKSTLTVADQIRACIGTRMYAYIIEGFKDEQTQNMYFYKGADERAELVEKAFTPKNYFVNFFMKAGE